MREEVELLEDEPDLRPQRRQGLASRHRLTVEADLARQGMTMMVVTHEMGFAREVCDRLVFIDGGQIVEEGPPAEFFANAQSERAREFVDKIIHH